MKRLLTAVALTALLIPLAASAQDHEGRGGRGGRGGGNHQASQGAAKGAPAPAAPKAAPPPVPTTPPASSRGGGFNRGGPPSIGSGRLGRSQGTIRQQQAQQQGQAQAQAQAQQRAQQQGQQNRGGGQRSDRARNGGNNGNGQAIGRGDNRNRGAGNRYGANGRNQWNRGWVDQRRLSSANRGSYLRYRASPFRWPSGYSYRRWSLGQFLPSIFLSSTYYITNFYDIGLPSPPPGTDWVRNGNDALLVDRYSGEIIDVVYDVFYW